MSLDFPLSTYFGNGKSPYSRILCFKNRQQKYMVDLKSEYWTNLERLHWRERVTPPLAVISLFFCTLAAFIYYIFPRLRVFPRSILSWINFYNMLYCVYSIVAWFPGSIAHDPLVVNLKAGSTACKIGAFVNNFTLTGLVACDSLIALTLFLMIKMKIDLEVQKSIYHKSYLLFGIGFPLVVGFTASFGFDKETSPGSTCVVHHPVGIALVTYPNFVLIIAQLILIVWAMAYARQVVRSVRSSANQFPVQLLVVRFMAAYLAQVYTVFPAQFYALFPSSQSNAIFARFSFISHINGGTVDALILILGNVDFVNWIQTIASKYGSNRDSQSMEARIDLRADLPGEETPRSVELAHFSVKISNKM